MENLDVKINILCARSHAYIAPHIGEYGHTFNLDFSVIKGMPLSGSEGVRKMVDTIEAYSHTEDTLTFYTVHAYALNAIGLLIAKGKLSREDVKVVYYGDKEDDNFECCYTEEGYLDRPWRIGGLDWDYQEFLDLVK